MKVLFLIIQTQQSSQLNYSKNQLNQENIVNLQLEISIQKMLNQENFTAIPFIYLKNQKFIVSEEAQQFLKQIKNPVAVLTIVGKYRTGKSLFLNRIMLNKSKAFKVSPTINSCTRGLWLWRGTLKQENQQNQKQILIIDTQGFGATQQSDAYNNKILLFALLLSSFFVYNSVGSIDQNSLNNISVIANLANQIQSKNSKDQNIEQHFPSFLWLVRDFSLNLVDKNDIPIQPKQYLEQALQIQKGSSNQIQGKNKIRRMVKHFFQDRDCFTMVRPVQTEDKLQQLDTLEQAQFRPAFIQQAKNLKQKIMRKIKCKKLKNTQLTGESLFQLALNYVQVVNNNSLPNFQNSYKHLLKLQMTNLKKKFTNQSMNKVSILLKQKFKTFKSSKDQDNFKNKLIESSEQQMKQKIKQHHSLCMVNAQQISAMISQYKNSISKFIENEIQAECERIRQKYLCVIDQLKEDNLLSDPLSNIQNEKQFKEYLNKINLKIQQALKPVQIPVYLIKQNEQLYFAPYRQSLVDRFTEMSSKRLHEMNQQYKIKLQYTQKALRQKSQNLTVLEQQIRNKQHQNNQLTLKNGILQKQLLIKIEDIKTLKKQSELVISNLQYNLSDLQTKLSMISKQCEISKAQHQSTKLQLSKLQTQLSKCQKQLSLTRQKYQNKTTQSTQSKTLNKNLQKSLQQKTTTIYSLNAKIQELRQSKQTLYEKFIKDSEQFTLKLINLQKINSSLKTQLKQNKRNYQSLNIRFAEHTKDLQQKYQTKQKFAQNVLHLSENLQLSLKHCQSQVQMYHRKQEKYMKYQKIATNNCSLQCLHCKKFFMTSIFLTHLDMCSLFAEVDLNNNNQDEMTQLLQAQFSQQTNKNENITFKVTNITCNQNNGKPFTLYQIQCQKGQQIYQIQKKFNQLCDLNTNIENSLPAIQLPVTKSIFQSKNLSKISLTLDQKKIMIEKYFNQLGRNKKVMNNKYWFDFVNPGEDKKNNSQQHNSKRMILGQLKQSNTNQGSILNYQMKKGSARQEVMKTAHSQSLRRQSSQSVRGQNNQNLRRQSVHTPEQFFKIWEQKQLRSKQSSSVCSKKRQTIE